MDTEKVKILQDLAKSKMVEKRADTTVLKDIEIETQKYAVYAWWVILPHSIAVYPVCQIEKDGKVIFHREGTEWEELIEEAKKKIMEEEE